MDETKGMLNEEIIAVLNTMKGMSPDTDKYEKTLDRLVKLYDLKLSEEKVCFDFQEKEARREMEDRHHTDEVDATYSSHRDDVELKRRENRFQWINLGIGVGVTILSTIGSYGFHHYWLKKSFKFEEDGTIAGASSRGVWNPLFKMFKK